MRFIPYNPNGLCGTWRLTQVGMGVVIYCPHCNKTIRLLREHIEPSGRVIGGITCSPPVGAICTFGGPAWLNNWDTVLAQSE